MRQCTIKHRNAQTRAACPICSKKERLKQRANKMNADFAQAKKVTKTAVAKYEIKLRKFDREIFKKSEEERKVQYELSKITNLRPDLKKKLEADRVKIEKELNDIKKEKNKLKSEKGEYIKNNPDLENQRKENEEEARRAERARYASRNYNGGGCGSSSRSSC